MAKKNSKALDMTGQELIDKGHKWDSHGLLIDPAYTYEFTEGIPCTIIKKSK